MTEARSTHGSEAAPAAVIALVWLGMLMGVSFLATPVKFVVQDLSMPVALQVGRATFALFSRVEWLLAAALLFAAGWRWRTRPVVLTLAVATGAAVLAQGAWLLPALDVRVAMIVAGATPPPSPHHALYAGIEAMKAITLAVLAAMALRHGSDS
jgi:hypothetical protein